MSAERALAGEVVQSLPKGLYRVRCENGANLLCSLGSTARSTTVKVIPGDRVVVEVAKLDPSRGKIVRKEQRQ